MNKRNREDTPPFKNTTNYSPSMRCQLVIIHENLHGLDSSLSVFHVLVVIPDSYANHGRRFGEADCQQMVTCKKKENKKKKKTSNLCSMPTALTRSLIHSLTNSLIHSFINTHTSKFLAFTHLHACKESTTCECH